MEEIKKIIREELEQIVSKKYSDEEIGDAIKNKNFIHTKNGVVYSPVIMKKGFVIGVNNECEHVNIPLEEVSLIQSAEERFGSK
ncbi:MAG: hypothetical protein AABY15_07215 [Nanoarchaeota archaeon]